MYCSVIVLATSKTVLNDKYAKKEIRSQVIRADALISHIKQTISQRDTEDSSDEQMETTTARFFLDEHNERDIDYAAKYRLGTMDDTPKQSWDKQSDKEVASVVEDAVVCPRCGAAMTLRTAIMSANNFGAVRHFRNVVELSIINKYRNAVCLLSCLKQSIFFRRQLENLSCFPAAFSAKICRAYIHNFAADGGQA